MNGDEIRQARERARLTQGELGEQVGVSGRTVGNWERGASVPRNRAARLVEVLGLDDQTEPTNPLRVVSDATLLAEIARRFEEGRTREKAGEGNAGSPAPMNRAEGNSAISEDDGAGDNVHELFTPPPPASETAAKHGKNRGRSIRREQDEDAERPDPDPNED